jgi:hypothetical protein
MIMDRATFETDWGHIMPKLKIAASQTLHLMFGALLPFKPFNLGNI